MPRSPAPEVRAVLIDRAAAMLARREPVTLRSLVAGTGVSTMAVYTYFDGMTGVWAAVRHEGFRRLALRTQGIAAPRDPVRHLAMLGVAYAENAITNPDLYRVMFDASIAVADMTPADDVFGQQVGATQRAIDADRLRADRDPAEVALEFWASGHGVVSLAVAGVITLDMLRQRAPSLAVAVLTHAGDDPARARRSVTAAWRDVHFNELPQRSFEPV